MIKYQSYLPVDINPGQVIACLGLISDTHIPIYCPSLPPNLHNLFHDVDLILHAGDIGDLWVLDELSQIAPVVAVQGNDEGDAARRDLPLQQIIVVGGQRILLFHSHHTDHAAEMQSHREDRWEPKLAEWVAKARQMDASIVVFGHTHIPMTYRQGGILLINPGSIAPFSALSRQHYQTVALLFILKKDEPYAIHIDLSSPMEPFIFSINWGKGYKATLDQLSTSLIDPDLVAQWPPIETYLRNLASDPSSSITFKPLYQGLISISRRCWAGKQPYITRIDLMNMVNQARQDDHVPQQIIADLKSLLSLAAVEIPRRSP